MYLVGLSCEETEPTTGAQQIQQNAQKLQEELEVMELEGKSKNEKVWLYQES